jgi:hypothetical protein
MLDIVKNSTTRNGNGSVGGRGVLRRKLTHEQRVSLAADVALGLVHVEPSLKQSAATIGVRPDEIRAELKARAKAAQAVIETTNGATVKITDNTSAESPIFAAADTPEVRVSLRRLAASLDCEIGLLDRKPDAGFDFGPYVLLDAPSGHCVWEGGLPVAGIADALRCLAHERRLPWDRIGEAWVDFSKTWT